jgi:RpiR family carbohydrate utilization transcriptional regulator
MASGVLPLIRISYQTLSASQKKVADYVLKHPDQVMVSPMSDLAARSGVSEPTIMRFLHKLNYDSYQMFRVHVAKDLGSGSGESIYDKDIHKEDDVDTIKHKVIAITSQSLLDAERIIDSAELDAIVTMLTGARHVLVAGLGSSSAQAFDLAHKLQRLGIYATSSSDAHMLNIMGTNLGEKDVFFAFSHSGESREVLSALRYAKENRAGTACVTSYANSGITSLCDHVLLSSSFETKYRTDAMSSRIIQMVITDIIYVSAALRIGEKAAENIDRTRSAVAINKT